MNVASIIELAKELDAYPLGAKLLARGFESSSRDYAWIEHEEPKALGQLVLLADCFMIPRVAAGLDVGDKGTLVEMRDVASTVLARRATS